MIITCLIAVKNPCGLKKPVTQKTCIISDRHVFNLQSSGIRW